MGGVRCSACGLSQSLGAGSGEFTLVPSRAPVAPARTAQLPSGRPRVPVIDLVVLAETARGAAVLLWEWVLDVHEASPHAWITVIAIALGLVSAAMVALTLN